MNVVSRSSSAEPGRPGHLVRVVSLKGVELSGFHAPAKSDAPLLLCLHGLSGGMDTSFVFDFLAGSALDDYHILTITCSGPGNIAMSRAGDNHWYMGAEREVADGIVRWMKARCMAEAQ